MLPSKALMLGIPGSGVQTLQDVPRNPVIVPCSLQSAMPGGKPATSCLKFEGSALKEGMKRVKQDLLFWQREVYERVHHPGKGAPGPSKGSGKGKAGKRHYCGSLSSQSKGSKMVVAAVTGTKAAAIPAAMAAGRWCCNPPWRRNARPAPLRVDARHSSKVVCVCPFSLRTGRSAALQRGLKRV